MVRITISVSGVGNALLSRVPEAERVLRRSVIASCEPFVPYRTGELCRSVVEDEGGRRIVYTAEHASSCYYATRPFSKRKHPSATAHWFEAAKSVDMTKWCGAVAAALSGGGR